MRKVIVLLILLLTTEVYSQQPPQEDIDLERFIDEIFAVQNGDVNAEELFETLLLFYTNPINLNATDADELRSLFILSEAQITSFIKHLEKNGKLLSIYELQSIPDFDLGTINRLLPFVTVSDSGLNADNRSLIRRIISEENNYLLLRYETTLENKRGYLPKEDTTDTRYAGNSDKYYTRFRISHLNDFSIGFTAEKDAGETLEWNPSIKKYGADFLSGHFQLRNQGKLINMVLGDYQLQFGQSLVFGSGFSVGKGAETITTVRRSNLGIRPYTSVIETNFFRGGAATVEVIKGVEVSAFYSQLLQDAGIRSDTVEQEDFINSLQQSGFHRTPTEITNRNSVEERNFGGAVLYKNESSRYSIGSTLLITDYEQPIIRADRIYNQFELSGNETYVYSVFGDYSWQNFNLFSEIGQSKSGGIGAVGGIVASLSSKLESAIALRHYDKDFHSFYGNAFGESTRNINESGWYWGLKYTFSRKLNFAGYYDSFRFPWLRSSINAPSSGYEYLFRVNYKPTRSILLAGQFREQSKGDNPSSDDVESVIRFPLEGVKRNYMLSADFPAHENLSFKSRVQWSSYDVGEIHTEGFALWQDIIIDLGRVKLSGRMAIFDTDDFDNAQYAFERDVLYAFSVPAYNGIGTRQYIVIQYKPLKKLTLWAKYARTHYRDRDVIGSGSESINGNIKTDIRIQARINF